MLSVSLLALSLFVSASAMKCSVEKKLRSILRSAFKRYPKDAPKFVRGVFHDSVDYKNLLQKRGGSWSKISGYRGGVDGCLYAPLNSMGGGHSSLLQEQTNVSAASHIASELGIGAETWASMLELKTQGGKGGKGGGSFGSGPVLADGRHPTGTHNLNIGGAYKIADKVCRAAGRSLGRNCIPDISVLGALVAVEMAGGPKMRMTWGRKRGSCPNIVSCTKQDCATSTKAIGFAPDLVALDDAPHFRKMFKKMGYTAKEQVALMGAHTFGKVQVCAGGMNGLERGPFCSKSNMLVPPLKRENAMTGRAYEHTVKNPGGCIPVTGKRNSCWIKKRAHKMLLQVEANASSHSSAARRRRRGSGGGSKSSVADNNYILLPTYSKRIESKNSGAVGKTPNPKQRGHVIALGFGDGGFWDQTPNKFDNEYFKLFAGLSYEQRFACCGNAKKGTCDRSGTPKDRRTGKPLTKSLCSLKWCRSDRKGRNHMKSTVAWHEERHDFVKKGWRHGTVKRMLRLAADWALLSSELKPHLDEFAKDEKAFFKAFSGAFMKAASMGYSKLRKCT